MVPEYNERISSDRTEALFLVLTLLSLLLAIWRLYAAGFDTMAMIFLFLCVFFMFYSFNYRTLSLRLTAEHLELKFGLFTWVVALDNVEDCFLDDTSLWRIGGQASISHPSMAGIAPCSISWNTPG